MPSWKGKSEKRGKRRRAPKACMDQSAAVASELVAAMREHFAAHRLTRRSEWVFHHQRTRRHADEGARMRSLRDAVRIEHFVDHHRASF